MEYKFLDSSIDINEFISKESYKIDKFLLKHLSAEIFKAVDFLNAEEKFLYIHGFLGTGKRQFINYITDFLHKDVIKLEYYCKASTVCDDILLSFIDTIERNTISNAIKHTAKITTLAVKFQQYVSSIKKPFIIVLHSYDDVSEDNRNLISNCLSEVLKNSNIKLILSTRAMLQNIIKDVSPNKRLFFKAFSKELFKSLVESYQIKGTEEENEELYEITRGYYYFTTLTARAIVEMKLSVKEFLTKYKQSGMDFDSFLGFIYISLFPSNVRNFFWFLRIIRHGISLNGLALLGVYDEYALQYFKNSLIIFQVDEMVYVNDYFQQDIDVSIPVKTEIKLHKYLISIYEKELKETLQNRTILISRQAMRAEIDYHTKQVSQLENTTKEEPQKAEQTQELPVQNSKESIHNNIPSGILEKMKIVKQLSEKKMYTDAIEGYQKIIEEDKPNADTLAEIRTELARLYCEINDFSNAQHYYETAQKYYETKNEFINLSYLNYELTSLYFDMYKIERAIETIKKVIYSVDTPQSLMVDACTLLGNIYSETQKYEEASKYYQKALESLDDYTNTKGLAELYFKYALMCDENGDTKTAFDYYNKCISINENNPYKSPAYSNVGSCYYENDNLSDAEDCFKKAYDIEKSNNNYEGIYYTASYLAKIYSTTNPEKVYDFLTEAKQCAEFVNEDFYIIESTIALGDYYYNQKDKIKDAAIEYFKALKIARNYGDAMDISKIEDRIKDMRLRIKNTEFETLEKKYG